MTQRAAPRSLPQRGFGLVEIMVGILIGMLMVLIIFQVYTVSEGQKRTVTSASDAQQNATFIGIDSGGLALHYLCGVRNRGHGSRFGTPHNYRVNQKIVWKLNDWFNGILETSAIVL